MIDNEAVQLAQVLRGDVVESTHAGHVVVVDPDGDVRFTAGDPAVPVVQRSSAKPVQALASLTAGASLTGRTLAVASGSHTGEPFHVAAVDEILGGAGLRRPDLGNVAARPQNGHARRALVRGGGEPEPVFMNCSGKHAAMLAACVACGWPTDSYLDPAHPLQQHVLTTVGAVAGEPVGSIVVDGCGAPCPATSLSGLARSISALITADPGTPERATADAMREHPALVGGTGHVNTRFMQLVPGAVVKGGAEGVLVAGLADGTATAVKCADGASRAVTAVALAALRAAGAELPPVVELERVPVLGGGRPVGRVAVTVGAPPADTRTHCDGVGRDIVRAAGCDFVGRLGR